MAEKISFSYCSKQLSNRCGMIFKSMFRGDIDIISEYTHHWSKGDLYYPDSEYPFIKSNNSLDLKVFFDNNGYLHVTCNDSFIRSLVEDFEINRYNESLKKKLILLPMWWKLLEDHATLEGNTVKIDYNGKHFGLQHDMFAKMCAGMTVGFYKERICITGQMRGSFGYILADLIIEEVRINPKIVHGESLSIWDFDRFSDYYDDPLFPIERPKIVLKEEESIESMFFNLWD